MSEAIAIKREIFIAADPETVFRFLVDPAYMAEWLGGHHVLDPQPGGVFRVEVSSGNVASGRYVEVTPPSRVAFTWGWENRADLSPGQSLVEIDLMPVDGGTLVQLCHSGLPASQLGRNHADRWAHYLAKLAAAVNPSARNATLEAHRITNDEISFQGNLMRGGTKNA